jgi:two-component system KDP operon response regulator KdpE
MSAKILVVDDEPQIRRMMRVTLTANGYQVADARNGEEALHRFREFLPDLVILDMNMPGMDGIDVLSEISG